MKGYIYTMYGGADPGNGWELTDPTFIPVPTLGACMPNIRRVVEVDDHIFAISGRTANLSQYVVGGFRVSEKIDSLAAFRRFPNNRMVRKHDESVSGNIIVNGRGEHHPLDEHDNFAARVENYIVGRDPIFLNRPSEIERARLETLPVLQEIFHKDGERVHDVIGRWRRLDGQQVRALRRWLQSVTR
jgi:hypothetical protein